MDIFTSCVLVLCVPLGCCVLGLSPSPARTDTQLTGGGGVNSFLVYYGLVARVSLPFTVSLSDTLQVSAIAQPFSHTHPKPQPPWSLCSHTRPSYRTAYASRAVPRAARACHHLRITQPFSRSRRPGSGRCRSRSRRRARRVPWPRLPESRSSHPPGRACQTA